MILEYRDGTSLLHRLDVRTKMALFAVTIVLTFLYASPVPNAGLAVAAVTGLVAVGIPLREVRKLFGPLAFVVVLIVLFAALGRGPASFDGDAARVLVHLWPGGGLPITVGGLLEGIGLGLRIVTMVSVTALFLVTTPIDDVVAVLRLLRVPFPIVFILVTAMRFVATMQHRADQILDAQRARGARVDGGGLVGTVRAYTTIMVPLFSSGIRTSEELAAAMLSRGYGVTRHPTPLFELRAAPRDAVAAVAAVAVLVGAFVLRSRGWWTVP